MMHTIRKILVVLALVLFLVPSVSALANTTSYRSLTASGPLGILVPLGFERVVPIAWAYLFYNLLSIGLLYAMMSFSSQRDTRFFVVFVPMLAGIFAYFGWFNDYNTTMPVWPVIIASALLGVGIYMKEANREKWGAGGGGSTLINFVFYIILLQACVGLVNNSNLWQENTSPTPTQYQNVDLEEQIGGINNTGGLLGTAANVVGFIGVIAIQTLQMLLSILATIVCFAAVLVFIYPFLLESSIALGILSVCQVCVWLLYVYYYYVTIYKPPTIDYVGIG